MSEPLRNEVTITLAGEERTMRATFAAMRGIEQALGQSVISLMSKIGNRDMGIGDTATIIFWGLKGFGDTRLTFEQIGDAVMEAGLIPLALPVMEFIGKSMNGVSVGKSEPAPQ